MSSIGEIEKLIKKDLKNETEKINQKIQARATVAANELRTAALIELRGTRSGKVYKLPGTHGKKATSATKNLKKSYGHKLRGGQLYQASAPGEAPARRFGNFRLSWATNINVERKDGKRIVNAQIISGIMAGDESLGDRLENGTKRIKPRPFKDKIILRAKPKIIEKLGL